MGMTVFSNVPYMRPYTKVLGNKYSLSSGYEGIWFHFTILLA